MTVVPLIGQNGELQGTIVMMDDVTDDKRLRDELKRTNEEQQELNAKLETTNEELESTNEELETTAEELQSTAEELETSNEELQSTNEELETSNEELRSLNEELETTNDELRERTNQLNIINTNSEAIINNVVESLMVLDKDGKVTTWNPAAAQMWGIDRNETIGKNFFAMHLTRGISAEDLKQMIKLAYDRMAPIREKEMNYKIAVRRRAHGRRVRHSHGERDRIPGHTGLMQGRHGRYQKIQAIQGFRRHLIHGLSP